MTHPGNPRTVMVQYRRHILACKRKWGTARGLIHYRAFVDAYCEAKAAVLVAKAQGSK